MRKQIVLPPEWQLTPVICPRCHANVRARYDPNTRALDTLRCTTCPWTQSFRLTPKDRRAALAKLRRIHRRSSDPQTRLD